MSVITQLSRRFLIHSREEDKRQHFFYSFVLMLLAAPWFSLGVATVVVLLIGLLKEVWDHYWGTGFCWIDMAANTFGILGAIPCIWLALYLL